MTFKPNAICAALFLGLSSFTSQAAVAPTSGDDMVNPQAGVVVGYWHNWCDGGGYKGGNAPCVTLEEVNPMYNVVNVSFMKFSTPQRVAFRLSVSTQQSAFLSRHSLTKSAN